MLELTIFVTSLAIIGGVAFTAGEGAGMRMIHKGTHACQTLPDKTIHCWKVEDVK
jgi:hypothetical protein